MSSIDIVESIVNILWRDNGHLNNLNNLIDNNAEIISPVNDEIRAFSGPLDQMKAISEYWKAAFPTVTSNWVDVSEKAEEVGSSVVVLWKTKATHDGVKFFDVLPSGREIEYTGKTTYVINNGKLVRYNAEVDVSEIIKHLESAQKAN